QRCTTFGFELIDDGPGAEAVGHDDIGPLQCAQTGDGEQSQVTWAGTDEQHGARLLWEEERHDWSSVDSGLGAASGVWIPAARVLPVCGSMTTNAPAVPWSRKSGTGSSADSFTRARPMSLPASTSAGSVFEVSRLRLASMVTIPFTVVVPVLMSTRSPVRRPSAVNGNTSARSSRRGVGRVPAAAMTLPRAVSTSSANRSATDCGAPADSSGPLAVSMPVTVVFSPAGWISISSPRLTRPAVICPATAR